MTKARSVSQACLVGQTGRAIPARSDWRTISPHPHCRLYAGVVDPDSRRPCARCGVAWSPWTSASDATGSGWARISHARFCAAKPLGRPYGATSCPPLWAESRACPWLGASQLSADAGSWVLASEGRGLPVLMLSSGEAVAGRRGGSSGLGGVAGGGGVDGSVGHVLGVVAQGEPDRRGQRDETVGDQVPGFDPPLGWAGLMRLGRKLVRASSSHLQVRAVDLVQDPPPQGHSPGQVLLHRRQGAGDVDTFAQGVAAGQGGAVIDDVADRGSRPAARRRLRPGAPGRCGPAR